MSRNDSQHILRGFLRSQKNVPVLQILAKPGPDSRFDLEANLKSLCSRSSRSSILKRPNRVQTKHEHKPGSNLLKYTKGFEPTEAESRLF